MDTLFQDLRYALRTLLRAPGFATAAVVTLGLGIGATTMIFSLANTILLRPFPFPEPDQLMLVAEDDIVRGYTAVDPSYPTFQDWTTQAASFAAMGAFTDETLTMRIDGDAERPGGARISAGLLPTLGIEPALGRGFSAADDRPGAPPVALISHELWQARLGGATSALGRPISIDGVQHTIIGVMPAGFEFPRASEVWLPLGRTASPERGNHFLRVIGRLRVGVTMEMANAELATIAGRMAAEHDESAEYRARAENMHAAIVSEIRPVIAALLGAVGFVLLIVCANVANLLLVRATAREREIAIRGAMGASRGRIIRQMLTESVVIALAGGVLGILLTMWWMDLMIRSVPSEMPYWFEFVVDGRVLAFSMTVALGSAVLFGLAPALQAGRIDQHSVLKDGARGSTAGAARARLRSAFVVAQVAASIVLLVGGLLMVRSFLAMRAVDPGFDTDGIITMRLSLPEATYPQALDQNAFHDELLARLRRDPAIASADLVNNFPISGANVTSNFTIRGIGEITEVHALNNGVTPGYFEAMGIRIQRGRAFRDSDALGSQRVAIISANLAERFFAGIDPIGRGIRYGGGDANEGDFYEIVGIAEDIKQRDVNQEAMEPAIYRPFSQSPWRDASVIVRVRGDDAAAHRAVREHTRALDADVPIYEMQTAQQVLASAVWDAKLFTTLFGFFAAGALALASIGLYAVIAFAVAQRTHEIGVRVALGATAHDVLRLVVGQGMKLTAVGLIIGLALAFGVSTIMESMLFGITARDPVTFTAVPVLLVTVAIFASWLPARRAARVDAMTALRAD